MTTLVPSESSEKFIPRIQTFCGSDCFVWIACTLGFFLDTGELAMNNALGTLVTSEGGHSSTTISLLLAAPYVGGSIGAVVLGQLARHRGIPFAIILSMLFLGLSSAGTAFTENLVLVTVLRFVAGFGIGAFPPLAVSYLSERFTSKHRGRAILLSSGFGALGGVAVIFATRHFTLYPPPHSFLAWQWVFLLSAILATVVTAAFSLLPCVGQARTQTEEAVTEKKRWALQESVFLWLAIIFFLGPIGNTGFASLSGALMIEKGVAMNDALLFVTGMMFGPPVGLLISGSFIDVWPRRNALVAATVVAAVSIAIFAMAEAFWLIGLSSVVLGICLGFQVPTLILYASECFAPESLADGPAKLWSINRASTAIAPLILVPILYSYGAEALAITLGAIFLVCAAMLFFGPKPLSRAL